MIINFLGDSITEGCCASSLETNFVSVLRKLSGYTVRNYGVGATRIARQKNLLDENWNLSNYDFNLRADIMDDADLVFVFGGTNDFGHGSAPLGNKEDKNPYTFYGASNILFEKLANRYGKGNVFCILPLQRWNDKIPGGDLNKKEGLILKDYVDVLKEVTSRNGIRTIELNYLFEQPTECGVQTENFADGLHPNDKGYEKIAKALYEFIKSL